MIINTGMRTDIPAFYPQWLVNRIKSGFVLVRDPYRPELLTRYELDPDVVDCIAFCTKDPAPILPYMDALAPFGQYWFVTITPYGKDIEPNVPPKQEVMSSFIQLSQAVGVNCIGWRYDPIFIDEVYTAERHIAEFEQMCAALSGHTRVCVVSFIDLYEKVKRNFPQARNVTFPQQAALIKAFVSIAARHGITVQPCAEGDRFAAFGADCGGCMTQKTYETAIGRELAIPKGNYHRGECSCILGKDIGAYDTCGHLCRYCYANSNAELVRRNMHLHDPESPLLVGVPQSGDIIRQARQESWIDYQLHF